MPRTGPIVISIHGPRATGKSTLAHELLRFLREQGHDVFCDNSVGDVTTPLQRFRHRRFIIREGV